MCASLRETDRQILVSADITGTMVAVADHRMAVPYDVWCGHRRRQVAVLAVSDDPVELRPLVSYSKALTD